jgi:DNA invertase Pin-like site-specific DNA recombinase
MTKSKPAPRERDQSVLDAPNSSPPLSEAPNGLAPTGRGRHRRRDADHRRAVVAVGYLRRSTDRQEQSIPDQQRAIEGYCAEMGLRLQRCFVDDAISGTSSVNRKGFQEMMACAQNNHCDFGIIVVYDVKRFGRVDNDEAGYYRHLLREHGVEVRYVSEGFTGDATDDLMRPVKQWQARQESKDLSKVTIRGLVSKSTTGHWMGGAPPFGYDLRYVSQSGQFLFVLRYNPDGTKLMMNEKGKPVRTLERGESVAVSRRDHCVLVPSEAGRVKIVQRVFRLYTEEQRGFKSIADMFNRERVIPARGPAWASHYSGQWATSTVRGILVNPAYAGDMVWNRRTDARFHRISQGRALERKDAHARRLESNAQSDWTVVKDSHEPIVTRRVFQMAQMIMANKIESESQRGYDPRTGEPTARAGAPLPRRRYRKGVPSVGAQSGARSQFVLSKLVSCAKCGSRYEGFTQRSKAKDEDGQRRRLLYYACGGYIRRGKSVCALGQVRKEALEEAVCSAVLGHYKRFSGARGERSLAAAVQKAVGIEAGSLAGRQAELESRRERLETTERKLVDNITEGTREALERRLKDLRAERAQLVLEAERLEQMHLSGVELEALIAETRTFLIGLEAVLIGRSSPLRHAALLRCIEGADFCRERRHATVRVRCVPIQLAGGPVDFTAVTVAVRGSENSDAKDSPARCRRIEPPQKRHARGQE